MEHLLDPRNLKILESFCLARTLFAFDFEGAFPLNSSLAKRLTMLNDLLPLAVLTGRKVDDVLQMLPFKPLHVIGNHGAEGTQSPEELELMRKRTRKWIENLALLKPIMTKLGIEVEDKDYSLTLHYHLSQDPDVAEGAIRYLVEKLEGGRITTGKFVVNVLPLSAVDKGIALDRLLRREKYHFCVYFGNDITDEDVFRYKISRYLTIRVGKEESLAKYYLNSYEELDEVIALLIQYALSAGGGPR